MFNLEQSIADWRQQMLAAGIESPVPLEELESHLRDEIEREMRSGSSPEQAFKNAAGQIGRAEVLKTEFVKTQMPVYEQLKRLVFSIAGVPNYQLATNMNALNSTPEPRRTTYLKTAAFAFPAVFLWLFAIIFLFPKLNEICQQYGDIPFGVKTFEQAPAVFKFFAFLAELMVQLTHYSFVIGGVVLLGLVLLEMRFSKWPRYRRAVAGIGVFFINAIVLASITMMLVSIIVAVSNHGHIH
jgi:hypothetical protein